MTPTTIDRTIADAREQLRSGAARKNIVDRVQALEQTVVFLLERLEADAKQGRR